MKLDRVLAIVRSMQRQVASELEVATNPNIVWNCEEKLLQLNTLRIIAMAERLEELEKEIVTLKLEKRLARKVA